MDKRTVEVRLSDSCCDGKVVIITYSECVFVTLFIQRAKCMRRVMWSASVCLAVRTFPRCLTKRTIFGENFRTANSFCFLLQVLSHTFLSLRRVQPDIVIHLPTPSRKVPVILVRF